MWAAFVSFLIALLAGSRAQTGPLKPGQNYVLVDPELSPLIVEVGEGEALRPAYHITAQQGWMNDPNGMFDYNNLTHVFYQWNPDANIWGSPSWGHAVSSDLVHWKRLPVALVPDTEYDVDGCFSGSAATQIDGSPVLLYTGVSQFQKLGYYYQQQAIAAPANISDPELVRWVKSPANPLQLQLPVGGTHAQFRDPTTPPSIEQDGRFWTAIGGQVDCIGSAILYSSTDLENWQLEGELATQVGIGETDGRCPAPAVPTVGDPNCDQKGQVCRAWECPDYFELDDEVAVLKWSDQVDNRIPFAVDWYVLSSSSANFFNARTEPNDTSNTGVFQNSIAGINYQPRTIDFGAIYASKSWEASDGRRLWMGWAFETAKGCFQQCSTGTSFTDTLGWQGVQTIPRVVTYDRAASALLFNPVAEVANLRTGQLFDQQLDLTSSASPVTAASIVNNSALVQSELLASFAISAHNSSAVNRTFSFGAVLNTGNSSEVTVLVNGTLSGANITQASVFSDRSKAGGYTNTSVEGGAIPLPPAGISASGLELHILLDRSLLEIFALGGRGRISSRIYPSGMLQPDWSLGLFGSTSEGETMDVVASVWQMSDCWVTSVLPSSTS